MANKDIVLKVCVDPATRALWERAAGFPANSLSRFIRKATTERARALVAEDIEREANLRLARVEAFRRLSAK